MPELIIIGGGPAGSAAGILLSRRGWEVTLFEQRRFPRDKVCGECLSALGVDVLRELGLLDAAIDAGAVWLWRAVVHDPGGSGVALRLPQPMLGLSRGVLDALLLNAARQAGVSVRQPVRCEEILPGSTIVSIRVRDLEHNSLHEASAGWLLLADGKSHLPGAALPHVTGDFGIKSHWMGIDSPRDAIELFSCDGCYGGLAPIEDGRWNAAFSIPAKRLANHRGDLDALFAELVAENRGLVRRLAGARRVRDWLASPLPRFAVRKDWPARVIPIGNAAAALEPIGGEGMGLALQSALLTARKLIQSPKVLPRQMAGELKFAFRELWRRRRTGCRIAAMLVASPAVSPWIPELIDNFEAAGNLALAALGKR